MPRRTTITNSLYEYLCKNLPQPPDFLQELQTETSKMAEATMQIEYLQACFMSLVLKAIGAKKTIEIGVFTGYSALVTAMAIPEDGKILACDIHAEWTDIAKRYWERAGVSHKIDLRIAPASETLDELIRDGQSGTYDFAFIDADKSGYDRYYEQCLSLVRQGGLIMIDNTLWGGSVIEEGCTDESTLAIRRLNDKISTDPRVDSCIAPVGDGLSMIYRK